MASTAHTPGAVRSQPASASATPTPGAVRSQPVPAPASASHTPRANQHRSLERGSVRILTPLLDPLQRQRRAWTGSMIWISTSLSALSAPSPSLHPSTRYTRISLPFSAMCLRLNPKLHISLGFLGFRGLGFRFSFLEPFFVAVT
jgi:hypothetical protein